MPSGPPWQSLGRAPEPPGPHHPDTQEALGPGGRAPWAARWVCHQGRALPRAAPVPGPLSPPDGGGSTHPRRPGLGLSWREVPERWRPRRPPVPCATTSPSIQQRDAGTWTPRGSARPPPPRSSTSSGHAGSWPSISTPVTWQRRRWTRRGTRSVSRSRFRLLSPDCQPPPVTGTYERRSPHCSRPPEPTAAGQS